jgi:hypothetical protein
MPQSTTRQLGYLALAVVLTLAIVAGTASLARAQTASSTGTTTASYIFDADLSGANEVPPVTSTSSTSTATTTGHQRVWFDTTHASGSPTSTVMWHVLHVWNGNDIWGAHLHCGLPGQTGPIVVSLFHVPTTSAVDVNGTLVATTSITQSMISATTTGCSMPITNLNDLANALKAGIIYANVHSNQHPSGVARGELSLTASSSTTTPGMATSTPPHGTSTPPHGTSTPPHGTTTPPFHCTHSINLG